MDLTIETNFINKCIKSEYRKRLLFELQSKKHRNKAISRFAHSCETIINKGFIKIAISNLQEHFNKKNETCYVISDDFHDGEIIPLKEAIELCHSSFMTVILISSELIVIKEEFEKTPPMLFVFNIN